jgi:hypothetical protein
MNCRQMSRTVLPQALGIDATTAEYDAPALYGDRNSRGVCRMAETALLFICALGRKKAASDEEIRKNCEAYITGFEKRFGHHLCGKLQPK